MARRNVFTGTVTGGRIIRRCGAGGVAGRGRVRLIALGLVSALMGVGRCDAQTPSAAPGRLSVRPHTMATGTRTLQAGEHPLESLPEYLVYVPKQCVGTRRVPLVVLLPGGGESSRDVMDERWGRQLADKYGMILLVPNAVSSGKWDVLYNTDAVTWDSAVYHRVDRLSPATDEENIDAALKQVLRTYAIDPDKIALAGMSDGGAVTLFLGRNNRDVFSRVAAMSSVDYIARNTGPQNPKTQFFLSSGVVEGPQWLQKTLMVEHELWHEGNPVENVLVLRPHEDRREDYDQMWGWLQASWAIPDPARRPPVRAMADSGPVLTVEAITQLTAFWARFKDEPVAIQRTGRLAHQQRLRVPVGREHIVVTITDMPALAAQYPAVAADLQAAGLTAQQHDVYRAALISAWATRDGLMDDETAAGRSQLPDDDQRFAGVAGAVAATSVLGRNVAFLDAHVPELNALQATGMWHIP